MLRHLKNLILDTLFPIKCLSCQKEGTWICKTCLKNLSLLETQVCFFCEKTISPFGRVCRACRVNFQNKNKKIYLDALIVSASYKNSLLERLIHCYKYSFVHELHAPLGDFLVQSILRNNLPLPDFIAPVPLHPKRERYRGFNQSELLAKYVGERLLPGFFIPIRADLIQRKKHTAIQMKIKNYKKRQQNISGAFIYTKNSPSAIENKTILLIDDVSTTGSTLLECAKVLKNNGAKKVFAAVIARQEMK